MAARYGESHCAPCGGLPVLEALAIALASVESLARRAVWCRVFIQRLAAGRQRELEPGEARRGRP